RSLVARLSAGPAAELLTIAGLIAWLAAAAFFLSRSLNGARFWAALVALTVMPSDYGAIHVFSFGEPVATARPLGEAAARAALGLGLDHRRIAGGALLALGLALHPLMAIPAAVIAWLMLAMQHRRWLLLGVAAPVALVAAAALGAPIAVRLFQSFDP